uniref:YopJ family acetyltransferase n=1 Tax=Pseudomonas corrugata TaxID=47879 RepID=UPI00370942EC
MADVRLRPGHSPSVDITEAAVTMGFCNQQLHQHNLTLEALYESGFPLSRVAIIETQAQKTSNDCATYSLHYAIKENKNAQQFDEIHQDFNKAMHRAVPNHEPVPRRECLKQT